MIIKIFMKMTFDESIPHDEIEDIVKSGEFFPANVIECEMVVSDDEPPNKSVN